MRFVLPLTAVALMLATGTALAAPANGADSDSSYTSSYGHAGAGAHTVAGVAIAGGAAAGVAGLTHLFSDSNSGMHVNLAHAPEISSTGSVGGLVLLLGGLLVFRGRQRVRS